MANDAAARQVRAAVPVSEVDADAWGAHLRSEFETLDVETALATMVADPYVNHIPTMTGGRGVAAVREFYSKHFIGQWPADLVITPISRTVGDERIVDEMLISFTHDKVIDVLLPGIPPTGRPIKIPTVAIVRFEGGKVASEHVYWDQASVLVQAGLLDPTGLPIAGAEVADKLVDPSLPSNGLIAGRHRAA